MDVQKRFLVSAALPGLCSAALLSATAGAWTPAAGASPAKDQSAWRIGAPIVTYWAGPDLSDFWARQMAVGGWNIVWCDEKQLDIAQRHGVRGQLIDGSRSGFWMDGLLNPATLDDPAKRARLDALIERVKHHPALYSYFIHDEPSAGAFPALGRMVAYLRERDPAHLAYINLFPTYANNQQLGTQGDTVTAYREYLKQYIETVKPALVSYDHYHFGGGDSEGDQYFLNLALVREAALDAGLPFLNIVQASLFAAGMRIPSGDELRWLAYTSLAYGAQGLSYYVYSWPRIAGGMADPDSGTPTPGYHPAKDSNRDFARVAAQLQPLRSLAAFHCGMLPPGAQALPDSAPFRLDPPLAGQEFKAGQPIQGMLLGYFGSVDRRGRPGRPTRALVVNLDHKHPAATTVVGPARLSVFDAAQSNWARAAGDRIEVSLPPGGGMLVKVAK